MPTLDDKKRDEALKRALAMPPTPHKPYVIDLADRRPRARSHPIVDALDALAVALADHGHKWTDRERGLYETAISYCGCTGFDLSERG
jgi:hypothetical protein